ncbi:MAG: thiol reductase thioredoxin [Polyangiaceae bacterium]|nr:thiol reductase thioredoxin [Polyangiaceae bacterium]
MILTCPACSTKNRVPASRLTDSPTCGSCKTTLVADTPVELDSEADFDDLVRDSPIPVLVDFWAPWCAPCRRVAPELVKLAQAHAGRLLVAKANTDDLPRVAARFEIASIPTLGFFRHGVLERREVGARDRRDIERLFGLA